MRFKKDEVISTQKMMKKMNKKFWDKIAGGRPIFRSLHKRERILMVLYYSVWVFILLPLILLIVEHFSNFIIMLLASVIIGMYVVFIGFMIECGMRYVPVSVREKYHDREEKTDN
jgi:polyferredoxin